MHKISLNTPLTMNPLRTSTLFSTSTNLWEGHFSLPYVKYIFLLFPSNCGICLFDLTERDWFRADKIILSKSEGGRGGKKLVDWLSSWGLVKMRATSSWKFKNIWGNMFNFNSILSSSFFDCIPQDSYWIIKG